LLKLLHQPQHLRGGGEVLVDSHLIDYLLGRSQQCFRFSPL
jgi:hypothetical protein